MILDMIPRMHRTGLALACIFLRAIAHALERSDSLSSDAGRFQSFKTSNQALIVWMITLECGVLSKPYATTKAVRRHLPAAAMPEQAKACLSSTSTWLGVNPATSFPQVADKYADPVYNFFANLLTFAMFLIFEIRFLTLYIRLPMREEGRRAAAE